MGEKIFMQKTDINRPKLATSINKSLFEFHGFGLNIKGSDKLVFDNS